MRIFLTAFIFVFLLNIFTTAVLAEDASKSSPLNRLKERIETKKEKIALLDDRKTVMASREATLKTKLAAFKDQIKAKRVEGVNTNLNMINQKRTEHMKKFLTNASRILTKLETRVDAKGAEGKDTTQAKAAIAAAKQSIASASAAVDTQASKDYTITVNSETTVKADAKAQRDQLHTDLKAVWDQVIAAKKAVANAIRVSATTLGSKEGSPSANPE